MRESIRKREALFKKVSPLTCEKPSDEQVLKELKSIGITKGFANTSFKSGIPRPTFSPNGQIAFVVGNKIRIVNTKPAVEGHQEF